MRTRGFVWVTGLLLAGLHAPGWSQDAPLQVPRLAHPPLIDGDLAEWRDLAFSDGVWTMGRLRQTPWFDPERNRLTVHDGERPQDEEQDLQAIYYAAWDAEYLYLGAEVRDNVNDVVDPEHQDKRWYFKDCVCWFIEAPWDTVSESFGCGDNAFCFVIDAARPPYAAWWRHGTATARYVEEPIPAAAVDYHLRFDPWGASPGDFVLEARVRLAATFGVSDPAWRPPQVGDAYGLEIVHTDPDGGDYGGHFLIYGRGDNDATWGRVVLVAEKEPTPALPHTWGKVKQDTAGSAADPTAPVR
ncbi:MAG: hypothetical protein AB1505_24015 [Candidatus Latescibacterota bacterium]